MIETSTCAIVPDGIRAIVVVLDFVMKTFVKVISVSDENVEVFSTIRDSV